MDRNDALIGMPIPIVTVRCEMRTEPVAGYIRPEVRTPVNKDTVVVWQPQINFFKTAFDAPRPIPVPAINQQVCTVL